MQEKKEEVRRRKKCGGKIPGILYNKNKNKSHEKGRGSVIRLLKLLMLLASALFVLGGSCGWYAFEIEPYRLTVETYALEGKKHRGGQLRIVQFSDLHIKADFTCQDFRKVVERINAQDPDIVLFTGDLYDNRNRYSEDDALAALLGQIEARYAKVAIWGNRDYGAGSRGVYESLLNRGGFTLLRSESLFVTTGAGERILITGLDDSIMGDAHVPDPEDVPEADFSVLMIHEPDAADNFLAYAYDLVLSGHSHGGQIDIPFLPELNREAVSFTLLAEKYPRGNHWLDADTMLHVNTGIGTTHISARLGVVPELSVFDIAL